MDGGYVQGGGGASAPQPLGLTQFKTCMIFEEAIRILHNYPYHNLNCAFLNCTGQQNTWNTIFSIRIVYTQELIRLMANASSINRSKYRIFCMTKPLRIGSRTIYT